MKVVHFTNNSRSSLGIVQGLNCISNQKINDFQATLRADIIVVSDLPSWEAVTFFDRHNLWERVVHYDYRDTNFLELAIINKCSKSFKRSVINRQTNQLIPNFDKIEHISHCALNEYYVENEKIYNFGCFFDITDESHLGVRRFNLIKFLSNKKLPDSLIGHSTGKKQAARLAIFDKDKSNCFYRFLNLQSKCKIIFTAQPSHCEGDNRTWEALASGGLVIMDQMHPHLEHPLLDGVHCLIYDAMNLDSIAEAFEKAKYYLKNETKRLKIAKQGFEFVKNYHRPINRANQLVRHMKKISIL